MTGLQTPTRPEALADWVELQLLFVDPSSSLAKLKEAVSEDGELEDVVAFDAVAADITLVTEERQDPSEVFAEDTLSILGWRAATIGDSYPLEVTSRDVRLKFGSWRDCLWYAFLSALSARYFYGLPGDVGAGAKIFERVVTHALRHYWHGESAHFGWPRAEAEEASFRAAFPHLIKNLMHERLTRDPDEFPVSQKDLMVDVVAWRPIDGRRGQSVLLCQCTTGDGWREKGIHVETWEKFVDFAVRPSRGLAVPFVPAAITDAFDWELWLGVGGIPFDRIRLSILLESEPVSDELRADMESWCDSIREQIAK